jgi:hypothetical protein
MLSSSGSTLPPSISPMPSEVPFPSWVDSIVLKRAKFQRERVAYLCYFRWSLFFLQMSSFWLFGWRLPRDVGSLFRGLAGLGSSVPSSKTKQNVRDRVFGERSLTISYTLSPVGIKTPSLYSLQSLLPTGYLQGFGCKYHPLFPFPGTRKPTVSREVPVYLIC